MFRGNEIDSDGNREDSPGTEEDKDGFREASRWKDFRQTQTLIDV